jgi:hypothetical protein
MNKLCKLEKGRKLKMRTVQYHCTVCVCVCVCVVPGSTTVKPERVWNGKMFGPVVFCCNQSLRNYRIWRFGTEAIRISLWPVECFPLHAIQKHTAVIAYTAELDGRSKQWMNMDIFKGNNVYKMWLWSFRNGIIAWLAGNHATWS